MILYSVYVDIKPDLLNQGWEWALENITSDEATKGLRQIKTLQFEGTF
jgi:hypothetical protein